MLFKETQEGYLDKYTEGLTLRGFFKNVHTEHLTYTDYF